MLSTQRCTSREYCRVEKPAREEISRAGRPNRWQPNLKGGSRLLCYLEFHGSARLLLNDCRSIPDPRAIAYFIDASVTKSHARSLLSIARFKSARSRHI